MVIKVSDINDNAPVIVKPRNLGVAENSVTGTFVGTIKASDSDFGENQNIFFSIINGTGLGKFNIDNSTGNLTSAEVFDYENKSHYTLHIKAQDYGRPPKFSTLWITVPIISVDEFAPRFQNTSYRFVVSNNAKEGEMVGHVKATDRDGGADGKVQYLLYSTVRLFAINNSSGVIYLTEDVENYRSRRERRDTEETNQPESYRINISASSGKSDSKVSTVSAEIALNFTNIPSPVNEDESSISDTVQTIIIAICIVAFMAIVTFLVCFFVRCKRKGGTETKNRSEEMVLRPIPRQSSSNSVNEKGLINNRYEHVPASASNSLESGSSGNGSCNECESDGCHLHKKKHSNVTDSGIQPDSEDDVSTHSDVKNDDARSLDIRSDRTDRIIAHLHSIESLHDFDDEGGHEANAGIDVENLLYAKCAEADAEVDEQDRPRVFNFEGRPDYTGSLSSILGSHEELRGHYNLYYAMNQAPQYQPLSEVFSEIGRLPNKELSSPLNDLSARTSMLSSVSSLHNQHLNPESTYSSLPITPNFTPAITPLITRSPSLSPLTSEVSTPMVSPSQSRPSSMYLPTSRPSSSLIQLVEREGLDDFDEDVNV